MDRPRRRLITIAASHYCEKARWALDRAGLAYTEEGHLPNFHYLASFRIARTPYVPILVDAGRVVPDSTAILRHVDALAPPAARLFPAGPSARDVERWEHRFDEELGPAVRRWAYWHWFGHARELLHYAGRGTPRLERALAPALIGVMKRMTGRRLSVTAEGAERAIALVRRVFDDVGAALSDGRPHLAGDRFSAADLGFAALASPGLLPPEAGAPQPPVEEAPPGMRAVIEELRATRAGAFALRLYAEERRPPAPARSASD